MLRRRHPTIVAEPAPTSVSAGSASRPSLAERLGTEGWVLPWALQERRRSADPSSTLIGTVGSSVATTVDPSGLVVGAGWSLDWWVGGDDRWHLPSQEASVRQGLVGDAPIVETAKHVVRRLLREDRQHGVSIALNEYEPHTGSNERPISHEGFEYGFILEGQLTVEVDGTSHQLRAGDLISYDSNRQHKIWNHGSQKVRTLWFNMDRR